MTWSDRHMPGTLTRGWRGNVAHFMLWSLSMTCRVLLAAPIISPIAWRFMPLMRRLFLQDVEMKTTFAGGVRFHANLGDHIESQIFWQGAQEGDRGALALILRLAEAGQVFFDIGANVGTFTLPLAARLGNGVVHAFEPFRPHLVRLRRNIELNGYRNVIVNDCALCRATGEVTLNIPAGNNTGMASIYGGGPEETQEVRVRCESLDSYVATTNLNRLDLIKIDVEGAELDVLEGGVLAFERFRPRVVIEVAKSHLLRAGRSPHDIFGFFHTNGYRLFRITSNAGLTPVNSSNDLRGEQNVYCDPC